MNGFKVLILKNALDRICEELYKELPFGYAEKAIKIIKKHICKALSKIKFGRCE